MIVFHSKVKKIKGKEKDKRKMKVEKSNPMKFLRNMDNNWRSPAFESTRNQLVYYYFQGVYTLTSVSIDMNKIQLRSSASYGSAY